VAGELAVPGAKRRPWQAVVRYLLGAAVGILVVALLLPKRSELLAAWRELGTADLAWVAAAIGAEGLSMLAFAWLQQRVLRLSGATVALPGLFALSLANDAIASSVPGEPAVSSAYRYRYYRRSGASGASAGWTIFTILIAQAIGMSLILLLGVVVALAASTSAAGAGVTVIGLLIVVLAGAILIRRDLVLRLAGASMRLFRKVTGYPRGTISARIDATLARMREIPLSRRSTAGMVAVATAVWCSDFLCLLCGFRAVHAAIPWHGVLLAYGVAQVAGSFPLVPGGLGIVEGSLAVVLAAYGAGRVEAVSAALAFRLVNFWLALAVGWVTAAVLARTMIRETHDDSSDAHESPGS
jgi:putative heme transporter